MNEVILHNVSMTHEFLKTAFEFKKVTILLSDLLSCLNQRDVYNNFKANTNQFLIHQFNNGYCVLRRFETDLDLMRL